MGEKVKMLEHHAHFSAVEVDVSFRVGDVKFVIASLGNDAGIYGAVAMTMDDK